MKENLKKLFAILLTCFLAIGCCAALAEDPDATFDDTIRYPINELIFPDEVFREYVRQFDGDQDGFFTEEELSYVGNISVIEMNVKNLKGIELFTNLTFLDTEHTQLTSLDVSANTKLQFLYTSYSPLATLTIGEAHDELVDIECWETNLTTLDVSGCPELRYLNVGISPIRSLDVSKNYELQELNIFKTELTSINISENEKLCVLHATYTPLSSLNMKNNPDMNILHVDWTEIKELDFTGHPNLIAALQSEPVVDDNTTVISKTIDFSYGLETRGYPGEYDQIKIPRTAKILLDGKVVYKLNPTEITLNKSDLVVLKKGKTIQLEAGITPEEAVTTLEWKSDDEKIATVNSKGKVTAVGAGTTTVSVITDNGLFARVDVQVLVTPSKVKLNKSGTVKLKKGKTLQLNATLSPTDASSKLTWTTSDKKVATVKNGKVTAKKPGTAVITVKTENGKVAKVKIKVVSK